MTQENPTVQDSAPSNGGSPNDTHDTQSQLGHALRDLGRVTRRLPRSESTAKRHTRADAATRERVAMLVVALGDVGHPHHGPAVDELTRIGDTAVPALSEALARSPSWLVAYRAAETLGQIGDGRASGALIAALNHPNSNVRWSAVRALAQIGDARALLALRRVARGDRGKTSWGEAVGGAAQSALDQMQAQSMLLRGADLVKTALACVLMIVSLIVMFSVVGELRDAWRTFGTPPAQSAAITRRAQPVAAAAATAEPLATVEPAPSAEVAPAAVASDLITGTAQLTANVRQGPNQSSEDIGEIASGDMIIITGMSKDGQWYRVRLGGSPKPSSRIGGDEGWVFSALISRPDREPPVVPDVAP